MDLSRFPEEFRADIEKAIHILKEAGCSEVYLFGSLSKGPPLSEKTDIDLAIKGLPPESFFVIYGKLMFALDHRVDLVDLDLDPSFASHLESCGQLARVA